MRGALDRQARLRPGRARLDHARVRPQRTRRAHSQEIVASSQITLNRFYNTVHVGLPYVGEIETMDIEAGAQLGTAQGKTKRIHAVTVRVKDSLGGTIGPDADNQEALIHRTGADAQGVPPPLSNEDLPATFRGGHSKEATILLRQTFPLPFTLLALFPEMKTND